MKKVFFFTKARIGFVAIFVFLLILSNLFLMREGIWFFQDAGYWPKNFREAFILFNQQFFVFNNYGYYMGYDQGLFGFNRFIVSSLISGLFYLFGASYSQAAFSVFGMIVGFFAFYFLAAQFAKDKKIAFLAALLYVFNPITYSLQAHTYFIATIPLFLLSFYKFYFSSSRFWLFFLLVNCIAGYFWVAYVRFLQMNFFIVVPYLLYWFFVLGKPLYRKKLFMFSLTYVLVFLPVLFSIISQLLLRSQTAFYYAQVYGQAIIREPFYQGLNLFSNISIHIYDFWIWPVLGISFFGLSIFFFLKKFEETKHRFILLNLVILLFAVFCFGLSTILGDEGYKYVIGYLPFIVNAPFFAYFLIPMPICMIIAVYASSKDAKLIVSAVLFLILSVLPLLNLDNFELQKFDLKNVPQKYTETFISSEREVPIGSFYLFNPCWRAQYMESANVPTMCVNWGLKYSNVTLADPRLLSGDQYLFSKNVNEGLLLDDLRITHNLKKVFVPSDIVIKRGPGLPTTQKELLIADEVKKQLDGNKNLTRSDNQNFAEYTYRDSNLYDFFIYSPGIITEKKSNENISLDISERPLFVSSSSFLPAATFQSTAISYKKDIDNQAIYYIKTYRINGNDPLYIGFNQTYGENWSMYTISKGDFESIACDSELKDYPLTNNNYCSFHSSLFGADYLSMIPLLFREKVGKHFQANEVNNGWYVEPAGNTEMYVMIVNNKQIGFSLTILISILSLLVLLILSIIQTVRMVKK